MKAVEVKGSVIWRLPGAEALQKLESGTGNDSFLLAGFDKVHAPNILKGTIRPIQADKMPAFFSAWLPGPAEDQTSTSREEYIGWVKKAKREIQDQRLSKVVIARRQWIRTGTGIQDIFTKLLSGNPQAFVYAFFLEDGTAMFGASPETLLTRRHDLLFTEALGGTRTRDQFSEKEMLEHRHISEYIGEILTSKGYSFSKDITTVRNAGPVEHLLTGFKSPSRGPGSDLELAFAMHPTSAICGLPYLEAFDFIRETESFDRKLYSGFLGPLYASGDFNLYVNLRCAEWYKNGAVLYAGAGLNNMSDPDDEWDETSRKMQTVLQSTAIY